MAVRHITGLGHKLKFQEIADKTIVCCKHMAADKSLKYDCVLKMTRLPILKMLIPPTEMHHIASS